MRGALEAVDAEIAATEADIRDNPDPRPAALDRLRRARAILVGEASDANLGDTLVSLSGHGLGHQSAIAYRPYSERQRPGGRRPSPQRLHALSVAHTFLLDKTEPVRTSTIHAYLEANGIYVGGTDPVNNLSAMLSNDDRFASYGGRRGWMVKQNQEAAE